MTMLCKKLLCGLMAMVMLLALVPGAFAEETLLQITLSGMYAKPDGTYETVAASVMFDVYQDGVKTRLHQHHYSYPQGARPHPTGRRRSLLRTRKA